MTGRLGPAPGWRRVYGAPLVIGALSLFGLLSALLLGDVGRVLSWFALALPLAICVRAWLRSRAGG
ncbi:MULTISPECIES: hypothetical protein [Rhodopseudomonas]|uniref:DUF4175 domain-containing protein n=1 Tax=Rhodopseudomonas palustris TaxID=1076 RepID=A0A0D7E8R9_RHOPL|nr:MULTISPECIES: hypothetical protein [Rhodopseudomonas]KIZ35957.1 hypothetical protein OO17_25140 [Rhodopseudomonas palustris]MDF3809428.1 hypothetical protein [Rhodopseudomonas sp. BAL398]WOK15495.1 hypothetical protein RBJ75_14990 [Rhodopseudomonas sp. BAL398]